MGYNLNSVLEYTGNSFEVSPISFIQSIKTASSQNVNTGSAVSLTFNANTVSAGSDISHSSGSADFRSLKG